MPKGQNGENFKICLKLPQTPLNLAKHLRGSDCKYRESADKLKTSKILITCQKNTFGELASKILLKLSGILLFLTKSEKMVLLNLLHNNKAYN